MFLLLSTNVTGVLFSHCLSIPPPQSKYHFSPPAAITVIPSSVLAIWPGNFKPREIQDLVFLSMK